MNQIEWNNPECQVTTHFKVKDCLWLPQWARLANEDDGLDDSVKENLINTCAKLEAVRQFFGNKPVQVHCMYRPEEYNKLVGGAAHSAHKIGQAVDFHIIEFGGNNGCDWVREHLVPKLDDFNIRMEDISDKDKRDWLHIDTSEPRPHRYFKP
jgi:hypothetical protein